MQPHALLCLALLVTACHCLSQAGNGEEVVAQAQAAESRRAHPMQDPLDGTAEEEAGSSHPVFLRHLSSESSLLHLTRT